MLSLACSGPDPLPGAATTSVPAASASADSVEEPEPTLDLPPRAEETPHAVIGHRPDRIGLGRFCSRTTGVCVHAEPRNIDAVVRAIDAGERALATLDALKLPRPLPDGALGGDGRLDIYLDGSVGRAQAFGDVGGSTPGPDRTTAFVVAAPPIRGCGAEQAIASAVAGTMLLGQDGALDAATVTMLGDYLALFAAPCSVAEIEAIDAAQRAPDRTFLGDVGEPASGSFLFPWLVEETYGTGASGTLSVSLVSISSQRTKPGAPLVDEPDVFDALRVTLHHRKTSLAAAALELAVNRAFMGSRSDDAHLIDVTRFGDLGRVRFEWSVTHASLPRRLAPARPVEPLGATYIHVDLTKAQLPTELTFVAEWEEPVVFRWALLELDESGHEVARIDVAPVLGETRVQKSLRDLAGAAALVIVGVNEGEARRDEPFDPGVRREIPRGYVVSLYK